MLESVAHFYELACLLLFYFFFFINYFLLSKAIGQTAHELNTRSENKFSFYFLKKKKGTETNNLIDLGPQHLFLHYFVLNLDHFIYLSTEPDLLLKCLVRSLRQVSKLFKAFFLCLGTVSRMFLVIAL